MKDVNTVQVTREELVIPTYLPELPDKNPMFFEDRVYQGSNGAVYPLPFTDRIVDAKRNRAWKAVWIENEFLRVLILPELGGRIHAIEDRISGADLIYRQAVIKPALIGLAGPWASGGIEFNWPQHHRPATFLPTDVHVEEHDDGAMTVWCSDHDPLQRMKGMHGVCLRPGRATVELRVRAHNRTVLPQTFLWWANVAIRVDENYQSFFPPDADSVADHAKRATSAYPRCTGHYYGVNYGSRARAGVPPNERPSRYVPRHCGGSCVLDYPPDDLTFYANIPVPTSYMCLGTKEDFFGGYDHAAGVGLVHIANRHLSPGKKQWTWGNHPFGYARDRSLTDPDERGEYPPYIELMAGVYTDNQPDFSFLQPGETKAWTQLWYPIRKIGVVHQANENAAAHLTTGKESIRIGVAVTRRIPGALVTLEKGGRVLFQRERDLSPGEPLIERFAPPRRVKDGPPTLMVRDAARTILLRYTPAATAPCEPPSPATEPPAPPAVKTADELWLIGVHLEQYRHATRCPAPYWREALRRDPGDARCNHALGAWLLRRGELDSAETHLRRAVARLTSRNPNPPDGEPSYHLGLCLVYQADTLPAENAAAREAKLEAAYEALYKSTWNQACAAAGYHALAEIDCRRKAWSSAYEHLERSLRLNTDNLRARDLKTVVLRRLGRAEEAERWLAETLGLDPLDVWARHLQGAPLDCDGQTRLDLAHDYARAGLLDEAVAVLSSPMPETAGDLPTLSWGAKPILDYTLGWLLERKGEGAAAARARRAAAAEPMDYCFPARLEEIAVLAAAMRASPRDARAPYYLGNLLYARKRHEEAMQCWEASARLDSRQAVVWRNLGIGYHNIARQPAKARRAYERAVRAAPEDARILFERDQLAKLQAVPPSQRLRFLARRRDLVAKRDDLSLEYCALLNQTGRHREARALLASRHFQTWEGGEGKALAQHVRTHLALGRAALRSGQAAEARRLFEAALDAPENLGEAKHLFANQSDVHYWLGCACEALGETAAARDAWRQAAEYSGDFAEMSVKSCSELTCYGALAYQRLGKAKEAKALVRRLLVHARKAADATGGIAFFVTSLPTEVLRDDLSRRQKNEALCLEAGARLAEGERTSARRLLRAVLRCDPSHPVAMDLLQLL